MSPATGSSCPRSTNFIPLYGSGSRRRFEAPTQAQLDGWDAIARGRDTLVAAPTGSGKTLAAFLSTIDALFREGVPDPDAEKGIEIVYVSPLKALSSDIQRNLEAPLREIREIAGEMGLAVPEVKTALRTGDTTQPQRAAILRNVPHILITTPESLYLMLTAERSRKLLGRVRTVIVDELHALMRDKRGSHLMLSLARLDAHCAENGFGSAGAGRVVGDRASDRGCGAVPSRHDEDCAERGVGGDAGHGSTARPDGPAPEAVKDVDEYGEILDRREKGNRAESQLPARRRRGGLHDRRRRAPARSRSRGGGAAVGPGGGGAGRAVGGHLRSRGGADRARHRTTLVFVNTRRLAERVAHNLQQRLGEEHVAAHHGSALSKERRLQMEQRLKDGEMQAVVATASLELGIDVGSVDLVCQIGSPRAITTFLQRIGRSGHALGRTPKGRLFPMSRDELVECAALIRAVHRGVLDTVEPPIAPLDILAQQIVAECATREWDEDALFEMVREATPYATLDRRDYDDVIEMLSEGVAPQHRTRAGAAAPRSHQPHACKGRRAARITALTAGGAIPELADYRVVLEPDETFIGTVNEDWAIESMAGDVFLLGSHSWKIKRVESGRGVLRVEDAQGRPPSVPFWLGEAPGRTWELSHEVERAAHGPRGAAGRRSGEDARVAEGGVRARRQRRDAGDQLHRRAAGGARRDAVGHGHRVRALLRRHRRDAARRARAVRGAGEQGLRAGAAQAVLRALRLRAAGGGRRQRLRAVDGAAAQLPAGGRVQVRDAGNVRPSLEQAILYAPMWGTRWRWNSTRALPVLRSNAGKQVPPPIQRMRADDLLAAVFPQQVGCQENISGPLELPDHPLIRQTVTDCLHEAMDIDRLQDVMERVDRARSACTRATRRSRRRSRTSC